MYLGLRCRLLVIYLALLGCMLGIIFPHHVAANPQPVPALQPVGGPVV